MGELFLDLRTGTVSGNMPVGLNAPDALKVLKEAVVALEGAISDYTHFERYVQLDEGKVFAA